MSETKKGGCDNPTLLPNGESVRCNVCWRCLKKKQMDWVGRCIAEAKTSPAAHMVTLTYGRERRIGTNDADHARAAVLTYSDVQAMLRKLRKVRTKEAPRGYPVRYICAGEQGELKGRCHWHLILFWQDEVPPGIVIDQACLTWQFWPHGFVHFREVHELSAAYLLKYVVKSLDADGEEVRPSSVGDVNQSHFSMSKKPPLGDAWFKQLAARYVEAQLAPQDLRYSFADVRNKADEPYKYYMHETTARNFLRSYVEQWQERWADHPPNSDLVIEFCDKQAERDVEAVRTLLHAERVGLRRFADSVTKEPYRGTVRKPGPDDLRRWMKPERVVFIEEVKCWAYRFEGGQSPWYFSRDPETQVWGWHDRIGAGFVKPAEGYADAKGWRPFAPR